MINESVSSLRYVDVLYAGVDSELRPLPAVRASPYVLEMVNVTITHCALDATNFTGVKSSTKVSQSWINNNRGEGKCLASAHNRELSKKINVISN